MVKKYELAAVLHKPLASQVQFEYRISIEEVYYKTNGFLWI